MAKADKSETPNKEPKLETPKRTEAQLFEMIRNADESGVSGTGLILEGVVFSTGRCVVTFLGPTPSVNVYDSFEAFKRVHIDSHPNNGTELVVYGRRKRS